jgi:hypothetical protein
MRTQMAQRILVVAPMADNWLKAYVFNDFWIGA